MENKDISTEYNDMLAGLFKPTDNIGSSVNAAAQAPLPDPLVDTQVDEAPTAPELVEPAKVEVTEVKAEAKESDVWDDWDATQPLASEDKPADAVPQVNPNLIYEELGKALGSEVKSKDDLVKLYQETSQKAQIQTNLPAELKKAIEIAKNGGDYLEFLKVSTPVYDDLDPIEEYENFIIEQAAVDKDGNVVDKEKIEEYLDSLNDMEKRLRGEDLIRRAKHAQVTRSAQIEQDAALNRERNDQALQSALRGYTEIDGFKLSDDHRRDLFNWVSSGDIMKDLFYDANGNFDPVKTAKVAFRTRYYDKLDSYQKTKIRNATKRDVLKEITNAEVTSTPKATNASAAKGAFGPKDLIAQYENQLGLR